MKGWERGNEGVGDGEGKIGERWGRSEEGEDG